VADAVIEAPYDKGEMATHDTSMPQFYTLSTPKCTDVGFTKWTSRAGANIVSIAGKSDAVV
jgi:hypothetical protein